MIYNDHWGFIHNPKAGGSSVVNLIQKYCTYTTDQKHIVFQDLTPEQKKIFSFGVVRNPWARMVSMYEFSKKKFREGPKRKAFGKEEFEMDFDDWLLTGNFWEGWYGRDRLPPHQRRSQSWWLIGCPEIIQLENLQRGMDKIGMMLDLDLGKVPHINSNEHKSYKTYYEQKTIDHIENFFAWEIKKFDYSI